MTCLSCAATKMFYDSSVGSRRRLGGSSSAIQNEVQNLALVMNGMQNCLGKDQMASLQCDTTDFEKLLATQKTENTSEVCQFCVVSKLGASAIIVPGTEDQQQNKTQEQALQQLASALVPFSSCVKEEKGTCTEQ